MRQRAKVLIVDDERNMHYSFQKILSQDLEVLSAHSGEEGLSMLKKSHPDLVVMDIKMPGMGGLEALKLMRKIDSKVPIIMMTAYGTVDTAIRAMKYGAYEYLLKPFDVEKMKMVVGKALETGTMMNRAVHFDFEKNKKSDDVGDQIVGSSESMQQVYKLIGQVAPQNVTALIRGESGTGKELVARALYHHSSRQKQPFLCVNCAAIPETLLESELFGYEKGAFTGAAERRIGKFEQVQGGTLFLDEIGEMSLQTQAKILRVIQSGEITRLGGTAIIQTDVRVIAATNRNLEEAIRHGQFREDLYYRLNIITIHLPSLRERREDIPELVRYFLDDWNTANNGRLKGIDKRALEDLMKYDWPGNVRQLENAIRRAAVLAKTDIITKQELQLENSLTVESQFDHEHSEQSLEDIVDRLMDESSGLPLLPAAEKLLITKALQKTRNNQVRAAKLLGINRNTLRSRMQKYGLTD